MGLNYLSIPYLQRVQITECYLNMGGWWHDMMCSYMDIRNQTMIFPVNEKVRTVDFETSKKEEVSVYDKNAECNKLHGWINRSRIIPVTNNNS